MRICPISTTFATWRSGFLVQQISRLQSFLLLPLSHKMMTLRCSVGRTWAFNPRRDKFTCIAKSCVIANNERIWIEMSCRFGVYPNPGLGFQPVWGWNYENRQLCCNQPRPGSKENVLWYKKQQDYRWLEGTSSKSTSSSSLEWLPWTFPGNWTEVFK